MNKHKLNVVAAVFSGVLLTGCATMEQSAGLAALGCAATGGLVGALTGSAGIGAATFAGCGAISAIAIYNYHSSQTRTVAQGDRAHRKRDGQIGREEARAETARRRG